MLGCGLIAKIECESVAIVCKTVTLKSTPFLLVCYSLFVCMATLEPHCLLIPREITPRHPYVTKDGLYVAEALVHLEVWMGVPRRDWKLRILTSKTALPFLKTPDSIGPKLPLEEMA